MDQRSAGSEHRRELRQRSNGQQREGCSAEHVIQKSKRSWGKIGVVRLEKQFPVHGWARLLVKLTHRQNAVMQCSGLDHFCKKEYRDVENVVCRIPGWEGKRRVTVKIVTTQFVEAKLIWR